ncbi:MULTISPECIES: DUF3892 domain-containing protein [unclassified Pseudomonas]|uniref:DUF3892 domain-containing protein n=1 Tax=unclassified Pseudomonas TaxID=196821 RepID=UPI00087182CA|nr:MULTISPECIES: DUF3892 domain-containing protein [unclassified Pseudomonas]SCW52305.1 Protein of unknown function [Pseudomonas sp. NFACC56-3]SFL10673.1 Protein of unknown function [Pseudomonas sp. NFACC52]
MADFCITKVKYSDDGEHIEWVVVREELEGKIGSERVVERAFVADLIRRNMASFQTRIFNSTKKQWIKGADIHVVEDEFLSTVRNSTKRDNLGNLPLLE